MGINFKTKNFQMFKTIAIAAVASVASAAHFHFKGWHNQHNLKDCQGDCDSNRNCAKGLYCAQTNGYLRGHGCAGRSKVRMADYCVMSKKERARRAHNRA